MRLPTVLLILLAVVPARAAPEPAPEPPPDPPPTVAIAVAGPPVAVFRRRDHACDPDHIPDTPARAVRDAAGRVRLFATHWTNRSLSGPGLLAVAPDCRVAFRGRDDPDPARFDDRLWLAAFWTVDGARVLALVHGEYQGHRHPGRCPTGRYRDCWWNAITLALSEDGGATFARPAGGPAVVAALPYRYDPDARRHVGLFNPSGLVTVDGAPHAFVFTEGYGAQQRGNCLLRGHDPWIAEGWRAWDGAAFSVRLPDPYAAPPEPGRRCAPVAPGALRWPVTALVRHAPDGVPSGAYVALMQADGAVWASASRDLLDWGLPARVMDAVGHGAWRCGDPPPVAYPSLLDPDSPSPGFETVGASAQLYLTRFVPDGRCRLGMERDLIRVPVHMILR